MAASNLDPLSPRSLPDTPFFKRPAVRTLVRFLADSTTRDANLGLRGLGEIAKVTTGLVGVSITLGALAAFQHLPIDLDVGLNLRLFDHSIGGQVGVVATTGPLLVGALAYARVDRACRQIDRGRNYLSGQLKTLNSRLQRRFAAPGD